MEQDEAQMAIKATRGMREYKILAAGASIISQDAHITGVSDKAASDKLTEKLLTLRRPWRRNRR